MPRAWRVRCDLFLLLLTRLRVVLLAILSRILLLLSGLLILSTARVLLAALVWAIHSKYVDGWELLQVANRSLSAEFPMTSSLYSR